MPSTLIDLTGFAAAIFTTTAFIPQAFHSWKTRDLSGVSLSMYSLFTLGVALWLTYGILMGAWPIIIANIITLSLAGMVLMLKLKHPQPLPDKSDFVTKA
jgi:MtN3 and saliva related transmembrane protein